TYLADHVNDRLRQYAEPPFSVTVNKGRVDDRLFVVVGVPPFAEFPILCRRDAGPGSALREGAIYTRSVHTPETTEVRALAEMREILQRAIRIGIGRMREQYPSLFDSPGATERFDTERGAFQ